MTPRPIPHKMCLNVGHFEPSHFGFKSDANPNIKRGEWQVGTGTCDCDCETCAPIHAPESREFFIYRYTPTGQAVARVTIVADGSEGIA